MRIESITAIRLIHFPTSHEKYYDLLLKVHLRKVPNLLNYNNTSETIVVSVPYDEALHHRCVKILFFF